MNLMQQRKLRERHQAEHPGASSRQIQRAAVTLAAGLICLLALGCDKPVGTQPGGAFGPLPVSVVQAHAADVPITGEWVGTLDGYVNAQIQPQVSGYLVQQTYREGSVVSKGQVLFQIDPRPFQAALEQAQGQLGQAQGQLGQAQAQAGLAQINLTRDTPLADQHAIAQSQLDNDKQQAAQAQATVRAAQAAIASAQANVDTAKLNLGFTQVRSLISGVAGQATTQVGNLVSPQSVLTAVSQLDPVKVFFSISDSEYLQLVQQAHAGGGDLLRGAASLPLTLTLSDGTVFAHKGRIVFVDRQMNQQTGAIRIAAAFPNPGNLLRPGQFGRVTADTQVRHNTILVPQVAVQEMQGIQQVYTVGSDNKVHVVNVTLGPQYRQFWVIQSGLEPGTSVITDNLQKLREGSLVSPHAAAIASSPASQPISSAGR
jgi:membrane fusion protein, multidrug efflux system